MLKLTRWPSEWLAALAFVALVTVAGAFPALAQDGSSISLAPFVNLLLEYIAPAIAAIVAFLVGQLLLLLKRKFGLDIDARNREALQTALTNGAGLILQKSAGLAAGKVLDLRSHLVADAVRYVEKSAPDALKHFGLTPDAVAEKIAAKLSQVAPPASDIDVGETKTAR